MRTETPRTICLGHEARQRLLAGVSAAAQTVGVTLGPKGRNVIIENQHYPPSITKDGVTVAGQVSLSDPMQNMGALVIREGAAMTHRERGDGTTTCSVLAEAIIKEVFDTMKPMRFLGITLKESELNPVEIKKGIDMAVKFVREKLISDARPCRPEDLLHVATISANNDQNIGEMVANAVNAVGSNGSVTIQDSLTAQNHLELVNGYKMKTGYTHPVFVNNRKKMTAEYDEVSVVIFAEEINKITQIKRLMEVYSDMTNPLLIIANNFSGEAYATFQQNRAARHIPLVLVKAPSFGTRRLDFLNDIAVYTGATIIGEEHGVLPSKMDAKHIGSVSRIVVDSSSTVLVTDKALDDATVADHIRILVESKVNSTESEKEHIDERIAALNGISAIIRVHAASDLELSEMKDRIDDSIHAAKTALEGGITIGGGVALATIGYTMGKSIEGNQSIAAGYNAVLVAIMAPWKKILENAGVDPVSQVQKLRVGSSYHLNVITEEDTDYWNAGIIDPVLVTVSALENAASVAGTLITTEAALVFDKTPSPTNEP